MEHLSWRRLGYAVLALFAVLVVGAVGFHHLLHEDWVSSFYRAVVTVSLTGLDSQPGTHAAQIFTIGLLIAGVAIFAYVAGAIVEMIAHGVLGGAWAERRRRRIIERMRDHYIICGYGRVGRRIAQELRDAGVPFVVLDFNPEVLEIARGDDVLWIDGRGTEDEDLAEAGLMRARGILAASDSDSDNLYIVLSARAQRPDLTIVARASDAEAEKKLRLAGADRVVQPYSTAGVEMATLAIKPQVAAFLDIVSTHGGPDLRFEEIEVTPTCPEAGKSIRDLRVRHQTGALIVALRKSDGRFDTTPDPEVRLEVGDVMIAVGTAPELRRLEELFAPQEAVAG
ncbi:MAG: potassium channel family protein [Gaiellaceae bacterium]